MRFLVTGSIAVDHLMTYPGRFADQLLADRLDRVSLSFLADGLDVRWGGVAANIAVGLARLGLRPAVLGAAGTDFAEYRRRLEAGGVDTGSVRISTTRYTARFVCTTDADQNQIATFYPGAMTEAVELSLADAVRRSGPPDLVVVAPDDPEAMVRHTDACRRLGLAFAADPSQQLARLGEAQARRLVDGARYLFTNEYEAALVRRRTRWTVREILDRVGVWVTTLGPAGALLASADGTRRRVPAVPARGTLEPTGAGDAFRAGFLAGVARGLTHERAAQLGCALATVVLESVGTQEYRLHPAELADRIEEVYGAAAAHDIRRALPGGALAPAHRQATAETTR
ncbi:carbohydrate kinase family protein [Streptomyces sp. PRKS01-65]|nr:carbohydrate kinase family protein [Streptomyces harenosi]NEY35856.1 carbohydrate kinase family protein [Streptomyces harenosi]